MIKHSKKNNNTFYSIWALFEKNIEIELKLIKNLLSSKFRGPNFKLHLTLSCCLKGDESKIKSDVEILSRKIKPFFIRIEDYSFSNRFFESFYLKVSKDNKFIKQKQNIDNFFNLGNKEYNPHISLFYGKIRKSYKLEALEYLPSINKEIKIDKIALVLNDEQNLKWKLVKTFSLLKN